MALSIYCDFCDKQVCLTEDGYCFQCGKHADNMSLENQHEESFITIEDERDYHDTDVIEDFLEDPHTLDYYEQGTQCFEIDEFTEELLDEFEVNKDLYNE